MVPQGIAADGGDWRTIASTTPSRDNIIRPFYVRDSTGLPDARGSDTRNAEPLSPFT